MNAERPTDSNQPSPELLDQIESSWLSATTYDQMHIAAAQMCAAPSFRWHTYLQQFWMWQREGSRLAGRDALRHEAIASLEEALAGAVAEGIARENGIVPQTVADLDQDT